MAGISFRKSNIGLQLEKYKRESVSKRNETAEESGVGFENTISSPTHSEASDHRKERCFLRIVYYSRLCPQIQNLKQEQSLIVVHASLKAPINCV
jgi:hypothetical protein